MVAPQRREGIWIEVVGPQTALSSKESVKTAFERIQKLGFSDIFLQVYREGRSWFDSKLADPAPFLEARSKGFDPIAETLRLAGAAGIRVHAWINVFNLGLNSKAPVLSRLGPDILQRDCLGTRIDEYSDALKPPGQRGNYFSLDAPKLWLDPCCPSLPEYFAGLTEELFSSYPALAGLHLDFFRYPYLLPIKPSSRIRCGFDFGYSTEALTRFSTYLGDTQAFVECDGRGLAPRNDEISLAWDRWRRQQVTNYLDTFRRALPQSKELSAALLAWPERAYFTSFQNWRNWMTLGLLDMACIMSYTADDELFGYLVKQAAAFRNPRSTLMAGIGSYLLSGEEQLKAQKQLAFANGAAGVLIFSYQNMFKS